LITLTHHFEFEFRDRSQSDLEKLNKILSAMKLKNLELKNTKGYLAVTQDGQGNLLEKRYGLDRGTMICTPSKTGFVYQIDTAVADRSVEDEVFLEIWRSSHPDRTVRTVISVECGTDFGYIILHHPCIPKSA